MTDRHAGYVVVLEQDIRDDDATPTINAIRQIRGVLTVEPIITDAGSMIGEARARTSVINKVLDALRSLD